MAYVWQKWLADALRNEGCKVREYDGWKSRGRPSSTGAFDPYGVLLHHTGTKTSYSNPNPTLSTCVNGRSDLPGPLCQVMIGYDGVCHVIAAGRANHGGECNGNGPTSSGDANAQLIGFEVDYSGSQDVSPEQADAVVKASAAVLKKFGRDQSYVRGHKETSTTGKWDPGRNGSGSSAYHMDEVRNYVKQRLAGGGDDMPEYVSLTGPGFTVVPDGAWQAVKFETENADAGGVHSGDYSWLNIGGARYSAMLSLTSMTPEHASDTLFVRWAEYDKDGNYVSGIAAHELPMTTGATSARDTAIDTCSQDHKVRAEVKANGGDIVIGSVGVRCLYWR